MALVLANRVQETATPNTTVSFTLTGAVSGFQTFAVIGNTNTTYYSATDSAGNWEVGEGTYSTTGPTLTRTTVYASSNSGSAVTFPGTVNVFVTYPSGKSVNLDGSGNVSALGTVSSGTWQGGTIQPGYGGTGLTTFTGANNALYSTGATTLTAGTLPVAAGGSGATSLTGYVKGNGTSAFTASASIPNSDTTATSANTANAIVARDASGNFSAGTITADLNGNAATATTAANVNNGTLSLGVSGTGLSGSATFTANQSGNSTFTVTSNATNANTANTIVARDASGNFSAGTITATLSGNASTATSATSATTATNVAGGAANRIVFNTAASTTNFVTAPTTASTFLQWNGSAFTWAAAGASAATPTVAGVVFGSTESASPFKTMIGHNTSSSSNCTVVIGASASASSNACNSVVIGKSASALSDVNNGVAVGYSADIAHNSNCNPCYSGSWGPIAIGANAYAKSWTHPSILPGFGAVAIGKCTTITSCTGGIYINATGIPQSSTAYGFFVKPVRSCSGFCLYTLKYNTSTGEIVYS